MRYLLDKNIVRFALQGLRSGRDRQLTIYEQDSLFFVQKAYQSGQTLFISYASYHIIHRWVDYREIQLLLSMTSVLYPTRYYRRWSRRVRETAGLSREDSAMVALGSFGTTQDGELIGVNAVVTFDQPLINGFHHFQHQLVVRLERMTLQLNPPFNTVTLPAVFLPS